MKKFFFFLILFPYFLFSAQPEYGATQHHRHKKMQKRFEKKPKPKSWWEREYMTGSWNDTRHFLADRGVTISSLYVINAAGNPYGGIRQGITQASSWGTDINFDLGKKTPLKGIHLYASFVWRFGKSLSSHKIGNKFSVQQVFGQETVKLVDLFILYTYDQKTLWIKAGRLSSGDDFLVSPLYYYYMSNAFNGNPIVVNFNLPFTAYPAATWGAYMSFRPIEQIEAKVAVYNGNQNITRNRFHGIGFTFKDPEGTLLFAELGYLYKQEKEGVGLPGNYKVGGAYSTERKQRYLTGQKERGNYHVYMQFDQMIYRTTDKAGITPFFTFLYFPENQNEFPYFFMAGLVSEGIFSSRPEDSINFGIAFGEYSSDLRKLQERNGEKRQYNETLLEINYKAQLSDFFFIQPNFQYVIRPSGFKDISDAFVIGVQSGVRF